ncbi:hypothetical protein V492_03131 [Pseudogymnoascus sp. VKM F-4246]|nr:hypothetical protein V492_03131 [Pseudogymnoascus sp. VKM F-4246]
MCAGFNSKDNFSTSQGASPSLLEANMDEWFKYFYATSDDGSAHQKYTTFFTQDATLIMGEQRAVGQADILQLRTGMWSKVSSRKHTYTYYSSVERPDTYLLEGDVVYGLKTGAEATMKWVAKAEFEGQGSDRRLAFYQVFLNAGSK